MEMNSEKFLPHSILAETIGIPIEIISNEFQETPAYEGSVNTYQKIVFQIKEEEPGVGYGKKRKASRR